MATAGVPVQVYEPYTYQLPPLGKYLGELWDRRVFAYHSARATLRGRNYETVFGQLWLVINPLLLALVYLLLITVISGSSSGSWLDRFANLVGGLFAYFYTRNVIQLSSTSITGGGKMIMNMAFPKALLPLSQLFSSALMYLPTLLVYGVIHLADGRPLGLADLWLIPIFLIQSVFSFGVGLLCGAATVYFRDVASLLPYLLRMWIYVSPVLYTVEQVRAKLGTHRWLLHLNPLYSMLGSWNQVLERGHAPTGSLMLESVVWAGGALLVGGWFFLSREREFAVRI